jgi:hypothetical protein
MENTSIYALVVLTLLGLNVFQLLWWSRQMSKAIDKMMCRNYAEYVQSQSLLNSELPPKIVLPSEAEEEEDKILNELNGMITGR